jgi:DNA-binding IclR family transcriptional regulator
MLRRFTPMTTIEVDRLLALIAGARKAGYAWADQETYRGDLTIGAAVLGGDGRPLAAINISGPTSRWSMQELRDKLASVLLETARAASSGLASRLSD